MTIAAVVASLALVKASLPKFVKAAKELESFVGEEWRFSDEPFIPVDQNYMIINIISHTHIYY